MNTESALIALSALAHTHRLAAYRALVQAGPSGLAVGELRELLGLPAATLTSHLNQLRAAGLISDERQGRVIRMRADYTQMDGLLAYLTENCCSGAACAPTSKASKRNC